MSSENESKISNEKLNFFGVITAGVTHELNNVISIMNELTGLIEDQVYIAEQGNEIKTEKLVNIHDRLLKQLNRGGHIIKTLNRFAHTADEELLSFDLNSLISNLVELCHRFANLKKAKIENKFYDEPIMIINKPFELQRAVFLYIKNLLKIAGSNTVIELTTNLTESKPLLVISGYSVLSENIDDLPVPAIEYIIKELGGNVEIISSENQVIITIKLPVSYNKLVDK
ncbi:hypothetical protein ACFLSQ_03055 [Bacteroidota bacterium]